MKHIGIFVATQKKIELPFNDLYIPIYVGAEIKEENRVIQEYQKDNEGENISVKNASYCELTALYWIWKNVDYDIVGLMHYRRFLSTRRNVCNIAEIMTYEEIDECLKNFDIILPKKVCLYGSVRQQYATGQYEDDFNICEKLIKDKYPEYYSDFEKVATLDSIYICNIFIMRKSLTDQYCEWIFSVLNDLEKLIDITEYKGSQKRIFGYLAERLFNVWIEHMHLKIKEENLYNTSNNIVSKCRTLTHIFEYKVLHVDVLKNSYKRRTDREKL